MNNVPAERNYEKVVELAKRRGFFWPAFNIYGGESGFYDYGPLGVLMRDNLVRIWKEAYLREDAIMVDTPVLVPMDVLKSSGHVDKFLDIAAECGNCHLRQKLENFTKAAGLDLVFTSSSEAEKYLSQHEIKCTKCGARILKAFDFKLMFRLPDQGSNGDMFLRPETAQGIFIDFKLLNGYYRGKLPMAVAQQGKGFRNEISPRQTLVRMKEFNMCEVEVFVHPEKKFWKQIPDGNKITLVPRSGEPQVLTAAEALNRGVLTSNGMAYFVNLTHNILLKMGVDTEKIRFRQHHTDELAHYSADSWDAEALIDEDWLEITGIADRNDLRNHEKSTGEKMSILTDDGSIVPSVIEPASGLDRIFLSVLVHSLKVRDNGFNVLSLPEDVAPYHAAIFPLVKKDGLDEEARRLFSELRKIDPFVILDESGSIGKRYARQDEIGTPYCITVDKETLENDTVTVRERDSALQIRIPKDDLLRGRILGNDLIQKDRFLAQKL
jgi:glycyl-tRNA synthetase